jgi:hypothetical protein
VVSDTPTMRIEIVSTLEMTSIMMNYPNIK